MPKWIDLNDASGARLKLATIAGPNSAEPVLHVFITNLSFINPKWARAIRDLGFNPAPSRKYLVRRSMPDEKLSPALFRGIFPAARVIDMPIESYRVDWSASQKTSAGAKSSQDGNPALDMRGVTRLGRNEQGAEIFSSLSGRFLLNDRGERVFESKEVSPHVYLRLAHDGLAVDGLSAAELDAALLRVSRGFVRAMDMGEVQHSEDFDSFMRAVFQSGVPANGRERLSAAIDGALLAFVRDQYDVAGDAYGSMARLYDYLPPYQGAPRGAGAMPQPLSIAIQRLLGDTTDKHVLYPNAFDGAGFAFLPSQTRIHAYREAAVGERLGGFATTHPGVIWHSDFQAGAEIDADALVFNADPVLDAQGLRMDFHAALQGMKSLRRGARAIIVLAADDAVAGGNVNPEGARFLSLVASRYSVDDVFETAPVLSQKNGSPRGLRVYSLRAVEPNNGAEQDQYVESLLREGIPVMSSWDAVKDRVTEVLSRLAIKEAETEALDLERVVGMDTYQRPYIAFSRVGEARTMVPSNNQAACQSYLTRVESLYGKVDSFIERQCGFGYNTLAANFSPEQVDGLAVMISRVLVGRSSILADDTGIGKGRQLAALATWANKRGEHVVFVTDRANLFSDLARDLKHIGEWDRFRPLVMNADGEITYEETPGAEPVVLASGTSPDGMRGIVSGNTSLEELQRNLVFLTYSQISAKDSEKALWVKNQVKNALVIFDEAHIAAGSDSNVARQVEEIADLAKHVQFASATWAKTSDNMHIYKRAFPPSVAIGTLSDTMRKGGDTFSEVFSTMLSAEGALIRREHDLSKLEIEMRIDTASQAYNERVSDLVADVLGAAAYVAGDMSQVFMRANADSVKRLKAARGARATAISAELFTSSFGAGSVIYQVMKSVQGALNAPFVADLAVASVSKGMKPVIVSDATGESLLEAMIEDIMQKERDRLAGLADADEAPDGAVAAVARPAVVPMPNLQDMLRHVLLRRLSMVKVEVATPETVDALADDAQGEVVDDVLGEPVGQAERGGEQGQGALAVSAPAGVPADDLPDEVDVHLAAGLTVAEQEAESVAQPYIRLAGFRRVGQSRVKISLELMKPNDALPSRVEVKSGQSLGACSGSPLYAGYDLVGYEMREDNGNSVTIRFPDGTEHELLQGQALGDYPEMDEDVVKRKRPKRVYREVSVEDLESMPEAARTLYTDGLKEIEAKISAVPPIPVLAFDVIAQRLRERGISVGEISGRKFSLVDVPPHTVSGEAREGSQNAQAALREILPRTKSKKAVKATIRAFNNGALDVVIMNRSAATGVSMHASPRFLDQARRHLIEHQIPEDPVVRVQLLGRVNRYDQLTSPLITTASTGIYGEVRYLMQQNRKLARMSANVRSSRDNAMSIKGVVDIFNVVGARAVEGFIQDNPLIAKRLGITNVDLERGYGTSLVNKVTMHLPMLRVVEQKKVYEELYSRFDEFILRAELEGHNPLRPNEMDVRAKTSTELVFFGDDSVDDEFKSAFDAPVLARALEWKETMTPIGFLALSEAVNASTHRLVDSGYLVRDAQGAAQVNSELVKKIVAGYHGQARLAVMACDLPLEQALTTKPVSRAFVKHKWMSDFLPLLAPGHRLVSRKLDQTATDAGDQDDVFSPLLMVITDIHPPAHKEDYLDAGKWKITTVACGQERGRTHSLRSLLTSVDGTAVLGEVTGEPLVALHGAYLEPGFGPTGLGLGEASLKRAFDSSFRGTVTRKATVLGGNMYLAIDWATATGKGQPVVYTDEAGQRHRGILATDEAARLRPEDLPLRISEPAALQRLLCHLSLDHREPAWVLDTTFKSALAALLNHGKRDASLIVMPGSMIVISCDSVDASRIKKAIVSGQNKLRKSLPGLPTVAQDCGYVGIKMARTAQEIIRLPAEIRLAHGALGSGYLDGMEAAGGPAQTSVGRKRKSAKSAILLEVTTPEKVIRATHLLREFSGLELYATTAETKSIARTAIRDAIIERREKLRLVLEQSRADFAVNPADTPAAVTAGASIRPPNEEDDGNVGSVAEMVVESMT